MSHAATNWAVTVRGIPATAKVVLWHLADRHNKDTGRCDPSQVQLAADCEISRSSLNNQLLLLERAGLIRREQRIDSDTKRQKTTFYILCFDVVRPQDTSSRVQNLDSEAVSKSGADPCPNPGPTRVQNLDPNLVREPGSKPVRGAREKIETILSEVLKSETSRDFFDHRKAMKKPLTERAAQLVVKELRKCRDPDAVANLSIMNGWQGVFPEREPTKQPDRDDKINKWRQMAARYDRMDQEARQ